MVPKLSEEIFAQLNAKPFTFKDLETARAPLLADGHALGTPRPIIGRLEEKVVSGLIVSTPAEAPAKKKEPKKPEPAPAGVASYEDFAKVELRVGKILTAERVPKSDKLLKLSVELGEAQPRTIAAGIAEALSPEQVMGKRVVVVANLAKRTIRGIESNGMLLAAGEPATGLTLVEVPGEVPPGTRIK
ncbi:MAG TPA: hypothetical protein DFS52_22810 [Myxococcales bacterium]|nr:hypothetical protein [Myxococcales bacterium]